MNILLKQGLWLKLACLFLFLLYLWSLFSQFFSYNLNWQFGYLDPQLYWQGLSDLSDGKVIYRDFYWEYGFLYLLVGLPIFLLLGKTFLASLIIRFFLLPAISIVLSFLIGREFFKKKQYLLLFLLLLFLYNVNNDFTSLRHLLPELGLILLLVGLEQNIRSKALAGGLVLGLSLLSSLEYGIAALISLGFYFLLAAFRKKLCLRRSLESLGVILLPSVPYFLFLYQTRSLRNFLTFTLQYAKSFYYESPCREIFFRLKELGFNSIEPWLRLNLYLVPLTLVMLLVWIMVKRKTSPAAIIAPALTFSLLIFYRVLNTPCPSYLNYGLTFLFLALAYLAFQSQIELKTVFRVMLVWFLIIGLLSAGHGLATASKNEPVSKTEFLPLAGIRLEKELKGEYQRIADFIVQNANSDDYIYVEPHGPYYQLTKRKSATSIASTWYYDLVPELAEKTYQQLVQNKPKLVVINTYNAWSLKSSLNNVNYNLYSQADRVLFEGLTTKVEDFISQNYRLVEKFKLAWVLEKREKPLELEKIYQPLAETSWKVKINNLQQLSSVDKNKNFFKVTDKNPQLRLESESLNKIDLLKIPLEADLGLSKPFSKYIIDVYAGAGNKYYLLNRQFVSSQEQEIWAYIPKGEDNPEIDSIVISLSDNCGFFWWGKPKSLLVGPPEGYIRNPSLQIDGNAF